MQSTCCRTSIWLILLLSLHLKFKIKTQSIRLASMSLTPFSLIQLLKSVQSKNANDKQINESNNKESRLLEQTSENECICTRADRLIQY